jgi:SH3-like domain-containing protein
LAQIARNETTIQRATSDCCNDCLPHPPVQFSLTPLADITAGGGSLKSLYQMAALPQSVPGRSGTPGASTVGFGQVAMTFRPGKPLVTLHAAIAAVVVLICAAGPARAADSPPSGLPVPRFVSVKADRVAVRDGPDKDHDVSWIYTRVGWPVEITAEFEDWRRIRDSDGSEGWVYHSLLSGKRMAAVQLKTKTDLAPLYDKPDATSAVTARLQVGVLGAVKNCSGTWCQISGKGFDGWIQQNELWGVYPGEKID